MGFTIEGFNKAKSAMLGEFNKALAAAEALRKAGSAVPDGVRSADQVIVEIDAEASGAGPAGGR